MPKPKKPIPNDPAFTDLTKNLALVKQSATLIASFCETVQDQARALELSVDARKQELTSKVEAHLSNPDLRPKFTSSIHKKVWTIALNDQIYRFGPREDINSLDDDEPAYFWQYGDAKLADHMVDKGYATSSTAALLACLQHYCARPE